MPFRSDSEPWLSSFRIWNLTRSSLFCDFSASANAVDDALGRERIAVGLEVGPAHQVADAAIEGLQLVVAEVLDDARDVAGDHRLVHHLGVDERQVG